LDAVAFHGWAELSPLDPVVAGSVGTWAVTYHVGRYGIDNGGMIRVVRRAVSDGGAPQTEDPRAPNYMTVVTTGAAVVRARYDPRGHVRPWQRSITIYVDDGFLSEGDTVTLTLGDTSGGSPGATAQTFRDPRFEMKVLVDCFGTGVFVELASAGTHAIVSGPPAELQLIAPTDVTVGEPFRVSLKALDRWGNPVDPGRDADIINKVCISCASLLMTSASEIREGVLHFEGLRADQEGVFWLEAEDTVSALRASSNAITVHGEAPAVRRWWGDLHGQSGETVGTGTVEEYFAFAREQALVDFAGHQANCFQITAETWRQIREAVKRHHAPGRFVTFLGYEWSGMTPAGGDRNVYFRGDDGPLHRCSHWLVPDRSDVATDCYPVTELYERLRGRGDVLIVPHVGGRYADMRWHDPALEPVVEICSSWGEFEWLLADALAQGYRVGITCGSDDHKGRPGASYPGGGMFGIRGGLLCVLAPELTRDALWAAIWQRRCYGTTGERIALEFEAEGVAMGGELSASDPPGFRVRVAGTDAIERIELRRGMECVAAFPDPALVLRSEREVRVRWGGARNKGRDRAVRWDGHIEAEGTAIVNARPYAFDSPAEGLTETTPQRVSWKSATTGDSDGVILTLDPADRGRLRFISEVLTFELALASLGTEPITMELLPNTAALALAGPGLGQRVTFERLPLGIGKEVTAELRDTTLPEGVTPYHVMVLQCDGAKAWASPIWVTAGR
jgi:hypothetical protein